MCLQPSNPFSGPDIMAVTIKTADQIRQMREAGKRLAVVHEEMHEKLRPGMSTLELNDFGEQVIRKLGGIPNFLHYNGFPAAFCISVNDEVVHGIPRKDRILNEGDIVSIDAGLIYEGMHSDAARTWGVGKVTEAAQKLMEVTQESFFRGIAQATAGNHLYDISNAVAAYAESFGYGVVRDLTGHGIGQVLHEDPAIPNNRQKKKGIRLLAGMTLAVEPMINAGTWRVNWGKDGWTVTTKDHSLSAHYENTILITDGQPEILTV